MVSSNPHSTELVSSGEVEMPVGRRRAYYYAKRSHLLPEREDQAVNSRELVIRKNNEQINVETRRFLMPHNDRR